MKNQEKKLKEQLEKVLYPHFSEDFDALERRLPARPAALRQGPSVRPLPLVITGAAAAVLFIFLQWGGHIGGDLPVGPDTSMTGSTHTEETTGGPTIPIIPPTSSKTDGSKNSQPGATGIYCQETSLEQAQSSLDLRLPDLSGHGVNQYQLVFQNNQPTAFRYLLNNGYAEIRKRPLKTGGRQPIVVGDSPAFLEKGSDYVRMMAEQGSLFFDVYHQGADSREAAEIMLIDLLSFYKE